MDAIIMEKTTEAEEKLHELLKEENNLPFEKKCLLYAYAYRDLVKVLNRASINVAKKFEKMYGKEVGEFVRLYREIEGLNEWLAYAIAERVLGSDLIFYYPRLYLFDGPITIYSIWKMLKEMGYPKVTDMLFYKRVKRARELIEKIC